jgi:hypothetical protein
MDLQVRVDLNIQLLSANLEILLYESRNGVISKLLAIF